MPGDVHSSQQREERTKKRRRCYRALSLGGWCRPPGPIKAEGERCTRRFGHSALRCGIQKSLGLLFTRCPFQPTRFIVPLDPASGCGVTGCVIPCCDVEAQSFRATTRYPGEENTRHGLENPAGGEGDKKTPPRRSGEAGVVQCARRVPRVGCYLLSITRVAFFNPLAVASRVILPGSSVEATMAVIMPENTFMRGSWNDSSEVGSPLAPAR